MPSGPLRRSESPLSFPASFGPCAIFLHPVVLAEGRLAHREADLRLPWGALVQAHGDEYYKVPTPQELHEEFLHWRATRMQGYLVFAWHWPRDTPSLWLAYNRGLQAQLARENAQ